MNEKQLNRLWKNLTMSAAYGAVGGSSRSPKRKGKGNQSTKTHNITITKEDLKDLWEKQGGLCYWLKIPMSAEDLFVSHSPFAVSVERLNNDHDYHKDNVVLTTRFANKGRGCYDNPDFEPRLSKLLTERDANVDMERPVIKNDLTKFISEESR